MNSYNFSFSKKLHFKNHPQTPAEILKHVCGCPWFGEFVLKVRMCSTRAFNFYVLVTTRIHLAILYCHPKKNQQIRVQSWKIPKTGFSSFWGGEHDEKTPGEIRVRHSELWLVQNLTNHIPANEFWIDFIGPARGVSVFEIFGNLIGPRHGISENSRLAWQQKKHHPFRSKRWCFLVWNIFFFFFYLPKPVFQAFATL